MNEKQQSLSGHENIFTKNYAISGANPITLFTPWRGLNKVPKLPPIQPQRKM